jgi:hypothetical protein
LFSNAEDNDFEQGFGVWTNPTGDNFDWILGTSGTATVLTGPNADHTFANDTGHYAFIEASAPRVQGDRAWLQSPLMQPTTTVCLNFWYVMDQKRFS